MAKKAGREAGAESCANLEQMLRKKDKKMKKSTWQQRVAKRWGVFYWALLGAGQVTMNAHQYIPMQY